MRRFLPVAVLLLVAAPAGGVITKLTPLKDVLESEQLIFVAAVEKVDPDRPAAVFAFDRKLKGDAPFEKLPVNLTGDAEAAKDEHTRVMLDRLEPGRKLVVFASKRGRRYNAMAFLEGTWFSLQGTIDDDGKTVRWAFLHCEPFLRRTFKGTTAELVKVVEDGLAGKADPPAPNEKEPPGFGPPVKKCSSLALFGVIPSLALVGPLAVLAALFPGLFARLAVGMKRWRAFLVVASVNSTLAVVYYFTRNYLPDWWVFGPTGFTVVLMAITAIGLCWAGRRYRRLAGEDATITATPGGRELRTLLGLTLLVALVAAGVRLFGPWALALELPMREFTFIGLGLLVATLYAAYRVVTRSADGASPPVRLSLSGETVGLGTLFLCGLMTVLATGGTRTITVGTVVGDDEPIGPRLVNVTTFVIPDATQVMSGLAVNGDRLYFGAVDQTGFAQNGMLVALDRHTGRVAWSFEPDAGMKAVFSTPTVADGKVYCGEGLHEHAGCRFFCVDAATGKPVWKEPFPTASHTEGSAVVVAGKAVFPAGDDGLYCADAATGAKLWQLPGQPNRLHIDGPPATDGTRVFAGSGLHTRVLLGIDATTGREVWRTPVNLRSFGAPLVLGRHVVFGLGTGNLTADTHEYPEEMGIKETEPAGAVVCVEAETGKEVWRYDLTRSVHTPPAADGFSVYATSRDGCVHCLDRKTGKLRWKTGIGGAVTSGPALATSGGFPVAVYAVSREGNVACLNPHTGRVVWEKQLPGFAWGGNDGDGVLSTPVVVTTPTPTGSRRDIYVGGMTLSPNTLKRTAAVFRFEDE